MITTLFSLDVLNDRSPNRKSIASKSVDRRSIDAPQTNQITMSLRNYHSLLVRFITQLAFVAATGSAASATILVSSNPDSVVLNRFHRSTASAPPDLESGTPQLKDDYSQPFDNTRSSDSDREQLSAKDNFSLNY
jgi:hypothetical protein